MFPTVEKSLIFNSSSTVTMQQIKIINQLTIAISMFYFLVEVFFNPSLINIRLKGYQSTVKTAKKIDIIKPKITAKVPAPNPGPIYANAGEASTVEIVNAKAQNINLISSLLIYSFDFSQRHIISQGVKKVVTESAITTVFNQDVSSAPLIFFSGTKTDIVVK